MKTSILFSLLFCLSYHVSAHSEKALFSDLGLRVGTDAENRVNLVSYEVFGTIDTDWYWALSEDLSINLEIETALGTLTGDDESVYGRIAPLAQISYGSFPVSLTVSSGPSVYSEDTFDDYDIGGNFQFTTSIGLQWECEHSWKIAYRFQHTSNAGFDDPNPGLEMHTLSLAYSF